jgi:hypothetical protein
MQIWLKRSVIAEIMFAFGLYENVVDTLSTYCVMIELYTKENVLGRICEAYFPSINSVYIGSPQIKDKSLPIISSVTDSYHFRFNIYKRNVSIYCHL